MTIRLSTNLFSAISFATSCNHRRDRKLQAISVFLYRTNIRKELEDNNFQQVINLTKGKEKNEKETKKDSTVICLFVYLFV
jgi:hypothetical protein